MGQRLHAVSLKADRQGNRWTGTLSAEEAAGRFAVQLAGTHRLVEFDLERLRLTSPVSGDARQPLNPIDIPPLKVSSARFHYRDMDLGRLQLRTTQRPQGLHLEALTLSGQAMNLQAQGDWLTENGQPVSRSTITMTTGDLGKALELFGYAGNVRGGDAQMEIIASWPGTPVDLSLARMSGDLQIAVGKGRLLALDPGVGRVFGLLSLQTLPRRLSWDFSDLFGKGFSFDQIRGHFTVKRGEATIRELFMDGPAARVDVAGKVDLGAETYDQRVTVTPHVSSGLPLAGALAGGIGAGAVLFVVQKLLQRPIEKIARFQYTVKGPWTSPVLTRVGGPAPNPAK
jgi:uncharacterized protein YhdP